ncbi:MAG: MmgE/PrpD family protein, partial [Candidatus Lambdaproteobacteria bacterium]|nr:MmgE/PrpD family protein [Candidatus Lambdaproteobacteria bacterium]
MSGNSPAQAGASPNGTAAARFIAATAQRAYAPEVVEEAKKYLVDWLGCGLGATGDPVAVSVRKAALAWGGKGRAPLLLGGTTTPALAALANGTAAHAMDYDDTHPYANVHVSGATWAATLAMAAHHGTGARDALAAFITGFETAARIGDNNGRLFGRQLQFRGFHPTSVLVRFAAAASSAVILGLDEARAAHALGIAA